MIPVLSKRRRPEADTGSLRKFHGGTHLKCERGLPSDVGGGNFAGASAPLVLNVLLDHLQRCSAARARKVRA